MISRSAKKNCFLLVAIASTILVLAGSATAFVVDVRLSKGSLTDRTRNSFSLTLSAGGFGKAPTGKSPSSKKKKTTNNKKRTKSNPALSTPAYISYDSEHGGSVDSGSPQQQATRALLEWLDEEEVEGLEEVEIGVSIPDGRDDASPGLRGVFAKRDFLPGEYMVAVPFVTTLLVEEEFDPSSSDPGEVVLRADEPEVGFRFWETFFCRDNNADADAENNNEKYKAFLDCLPMTPDDPNFDGTPDFWSEDDIRRLEIPGVIDKMLSRKKGITGFADRLSENRAAAAADGNDGENNDGDDTDLASSSALATIQQCCWLVQSRAFTTYKKAMSIDGTVGLLSRVVLIPFIDMINHASRKLANAEMQVVETKEYDESFYALVATQPIQKGTELKICYGTGEETALEIFSKYGFWPEVEDPGKEKAALQELLEEVQWSTTLEEDQAMLATEEGSREPMRSILSIRIYAKSHVVM
jgi:hypothetical protein